MCFGNWWSLWECVTIDHALGNWSGLCVGRLKRLREGRLCAEVYPLRFLWQYRRGRGGIVAWCVAMGLVRASILYICMYLYI